jgi:hypothetical protein
MQQAFILLLYRSVQSILLRWIKKCHCTGSCHASVVAHFSAFNVLRPVMPLCRINLATVLDQSFHCAGSSHVTVLDQIIVVYQAIATVFDQ